VGAVVADQHGGGGHQPLQPQAEHGAGGACHEWQERAASSAAKLPLPHRSASAAALKGDPKARPREPASRSCLARRSAQESAANAALCERARLRARRRPAGAHLAHDVGGAGGVMGDAELQQA
jgi:hypothetical protein